jgi:hypothetical protein
MSKVFVILYILFICLFDFVPKWVATDCFIGFVVWAIAYVYISRKRMAANIHADVESLRLRKLFVSFLLVAVLYLLVSFANLPRYWGIEHLRYDKAYIPRHFVVVAELFVPIVLGYGIYRMKLYHYMKVPLLILFIVLMMLLTPALCTKGIVLLALVFIAWKCRSKFLMLSAILIHYEQSSYVLGYIAMMVILLLERLFVAFLRTATTLKVLVMLLVGIFVIFVLSGVIAVYVEADNNSLWRLNVWINELLSLYKSNFMGVGFGSAYVTDNIVMQVESVSMFIDFDRGGIERRVFEVANHSSLLNMFYRMGVVGGLMFLLLNLQIIRLVIKTYHRARPRFQSLLWYMFSVWVYETIVIFLNPGLEMMQFAISYMLSVAFLLAVVFEINLEAKNRSSSIVKL